MIMFQVPDAKPGAPAIATVDGAILVARTEEEAAKVPAAFRSVTFQVITVDEWLDVAGHLGRTEP